tara:strand:- start:482 stop:1087 length:606 start_codon:yes stop_codon:yes gene_type:complete
VESREVPQRSQGGPRLTTVSQTEMLIVDWRGGNDDARDRLIARLLPDLEQIAAARLRREDSSSLSTHDLINEAVERLIRAGEIDLASRAHFLALSSRLMRNILVDHARARRADKRAHHAVELTTNVEGEVRIDLQALDSALIRLGAIEPSLMEIVEMRYFGGMTQGEIGEATGWSEATVKRRWRVARAWLADALSDPLGDG